MSFSDSGHPWLILFCVALCALVIGYPVWSIRRARRATTWPTAPATLALAEVVLAPTGSRGQSGGWGVEVRYAYDVNGAAYEGRRLAFGYFPGGDESAAEEIVQRLRGASALRVRYDPRDPSTSCLSVGVPKVAKYLLVFGAAVAWFFSAVCAAILLEEGLLPERARPAVVALVLSIFPVFAVAFFLCWRFGTGMERAVVRNLVTG